MDYKWLLMFVVVFNSSCSALTDEILPSPTPTPLTGFQKMKIQLGNPCDEKYSIGLHTISYCVDKCRGTCLNPDSKWTVIAGGDKTYKTCICSHQMDIYFRPPDDALLFYRINPPL